MDSDDIAPYDFAYNLFAKNIIERRLVNGSDILRMSSLLRLFRDYVQKYENMDASQYR